MKLTAAQIRQARALLGWSSARFARTAKIGFDKIVKAQDEDGFQTLSGIDLRVIQATLERAGIVIAADGPRLRKDQA